MSWFAAIPAALSAAGQLADQFDVGGDKGARDRQQFNEALAEKQFKLQDDMTKMGIRWRVEDARAAGIHPALALGAQLSAPSAVSVFNEPASSTGSSWAGFGQDLGRAIDATRTDAERTASRLDELRIERGELENDLLRSQIARLNQQSGPPTPGAPGGTLGTNTIVESPLERVTGLDGNPSAEPGAITDYGWTAQPGGRLQPVPSKDAKERIEESFVLESLWALRNLILPGNRRKPPVDKPGWLPEGYNDWDWDQVRMMWKPVRRREVYRGPIPAFEQHR